MYKPPEYSSKCCLSREQDICCCRLSLAKAFSFFNDSNYTQNTPVGTEDQKDDSHIYPDRSDEVVLHLNTDVQRIYVALSAYMAYVATSESPA